MTAQQFSYTTGSTFLQDTGEVSYNGCVFSPYFLTSMSGDVVKDAANRTTKLMRYTLIVDGYVTQGVNQTLQGIGINPSMQTLQTLLTTQGGQLKYSGRGFDFLVNAKGKAIFDNAQRDVAWGPVPKLLEFQPLGGGNSAKVVWQVTFDVVVMPTAEIGVSSALLQFNCETEVSYDEAGYSKLSVKGVMEIPLNRGVGRASTRTVDTLRDQLDKRIFSGIDFSRFRVVNRDYPVSRDKRTLEFNVVVEEKSYMDLPPDSMAAHGTYSVKQETAGMGLVRFLCTLSATYTVAVGRPKRAAYFAFLALMRERMRHSVIGTDPGLGIPDWEAPQYDTSITFWEKLLRNQEAVLPPKSVMSAFLLAYSFDEGLYLDSKTITFSATWRLVVTDVAFLLEASGIWKKLPEEDRQGNNLWAVSVEDISKSQSWLRNTLDPKLDVIVDFGGG